ncbi:InlB B-repeat-containing protein [Idiomarina xiamenensis]|uniref:Internalin-like protein n=1 Tax=Idiomarina xiamenensis 10-D-4 TaxID=740709 RepID=K2KIA6_9GAMM|nr:InlB B-repeat-containing protein [Idiomarina xiamenensis]EKE87623.1 internalin-like protein [Idiomarina xiamenensis 10-D-4]
MINVKSWLYKFVLLSSLPLASALATNDVAVDNSDYAPRVLTNGAVSLASPMQRLQAQIDAQGATLTVAHEQGADEQVSVRPISLGRIQQQLLSAGHVVTDAQRVLLKRQQLTEIFSSSMHGVRQDFLISQRPQGDGALSLTLAFQGANVAGAGQGVNVTTANGRELSYHKLQVIDADGQRLAATMRATAHNRLTIEVDDRAARYPVLIDPTFSDANWQAFAPDAGGSPNNQVRAMVEYQGDLYVGGTFAQVAGEQVYYIARWNGYRWQKLGDGVNNAVYAMTVFNDKLIVGGSFTTASGESVLRIASWDGNNWQALGDGLNSSVVDLTVYNGELIAGGIFTAAGGISVNRIARWDGSNWHAMGGPDQGTVNSVSEYNGDLIVVGSFYMVNGENHNYITRWDGSSWSSLGEGLNTTVNDAVEFQGKLYVTGQFTGSGGHALPYIAAWDGSAWSAVGGGLSDAGYSLYADNDKLYVGGQFETADGISSLGIAAWDGSSWQAVGDGLGLYAGTVIRIYRIAKFDNEILLGGLLDKNGVVNLVRLNNDSEWQGFQSTFLDGSTQVVAEYDGDTIVGGDFTEISGIAANRIARWDGSQWHAMGDGFNGTVTTIASYQGELYAAGAFDHSGSSAVAHVARWDSDGQTWQPLTIGVNNTVYRVKVINDELWILGDFSSAGGESATGMARWDGSQWLSVDFPYQVHYGPTDVVEYQGEVVVSGRFYNPEGFLLFKVAAFDGEQWYPLELDAVTGMVLSMAVHDDVLYVTGNIYRMNESVSASGVAAWDGSQWSNVGDSDVGSGKTLQSFKQELFLGSDSGLYVLKNGAFQQPDTSVNQLINGLDAANDSLYLTGSFSSAGGKPAQNLARLIPTVSVSLDEQQGAGAVATKYFPGSTIKLPQPTREHYNFTGWNTASDGSGTNYTTNLPLISSAVSLYAQWQLKSYTISFDSAGGSSVADMEVAYGASVTAPTAPTRTGYTFTGWSPELPSTMPGEDLSVTAQWQKNSYTVTFNLGAGTPLTEIVEFGEAIPLPTVPARTGYTFTGWSPALPSTMPANDVTVTAQWQVNSYTLSFDSNGGSAVAAQNVNYGAAVTAPAAPTRTGYSFTGWSPALPSTMPANDVAVTAQWQVNSYTLSFDSNGGSAVAAQSIDYGATVTAPVAPTRLGYTFVGWSPVLPSTMPANDVTAIAQWQANSYIIAFDSDGGSAIESQTYSYGATVNAPTAPTREGYTFKGWTPQLPPTMPAENLTVKAQWQVNQYTITFDTDGGSAIEPLTADFGAQVAKPQTPTKEDHTFVSWQPAIPETMPANDVTVVAQWQESAKVTVTARVEGNGQVTPASQTVKRGERASFTLTLADVEDYVVLAGSCSASRSDMTITTARVTEDCELIIHVYDSTDAEKDQDGPVGGSQAVGFRLNGGAGDKALQWVDRLRGGVETRLKGAEAEALISLQEDGSFIFLAELTGRYSLRFRDEVSGEITELSFDVMPYLAFSASRQLAQQEQTVDVGVWLSDEPIEYPVSATLNRDALGQSPLALSFDEPQSLQQVLSMQASASATEVQLTLADIEQALAGSPATTTLRLTEQALPLTVQLSSHQASEQQTRIVSRDSGVVTLTAALKSGADAEFSWQSDIDLSVAGSSASFDPQSVDNGSYLISVEATAAERSGQAEITLTVVDSCPDNDCAGLVKGLPTAADQNAERLNRLAICPAAVGSARSSACGENEDGFIEVPSLYTLTLGVLSAEQSWQSQQFGTVLNDASLGEDEGFNQLGAMVNFNVVDITAPGDIVPVAIPLVSGVSIPQGAVWRKWIDGQWQTFVEDDSNRIDSAEKMSNGRCPVVSADSWTPGLSAGHGCVRLFIEDGGPNDDDGQVNGSIRDPGVLAVEAEVEPEPPVEPEPTRPAETRSGGNIGGGLLLLLGALLGLRTRAIRQALKRSALMALAVLGVTHQAAAQEWYLGAEALQIHSDVKAEQVEADLAALGYADSGLNIDDKSRQGLRLYGGWQVNPVLAFELAWVDTNEITTSFARLPEDVDTDSLKDVWPVSGKGPELSLLLTPFTDSEQWRPGVRLGVWRMRSDSDFRQGRTVQMLENDDTVMVLETFTRYQVNSHWAVKLGVSHYRLHAAPMNTVTVGLNYRF